MKTSNPLKKEKYISNLKKTISAIPLVSGGIVKDVINGIDASCIISGTRYGIVNGVVTEFGVNQPALEDDGFRGCPAFTQLIRKTRTLTDALWSKVSVISILGSNKISYLGDGTNTAYIEQAAAVPGGTASKIMTAVVKVSADVYPQKFRIKNTHKGVLDNYSSDITITKPEILFFQVVNAASAGTGNQSAGIVPATDNSAFLIYAEINLAAANFVYPYSPNNTTSNVSFVSEAATATAGTSFDLDDPKLVKFKEGLRGKAVGANLWAGVPTLYTGWSDDGTNYVSSGSNATSPVWLIGVVIPAQMIEVTFTTGDVASGNLIVYANAAGVVISSIAPNTTYTVRMMGGDSTSLALTSSTFTGKIVKGSIFFRPVSAQGHLELTFKSNVDSEWLPLGSTTTINLLNVNNDDTGDLLYIKKDTDGNVRFSCYSSPAVASVNSVIGCGQIYKISLDWGTHSTGQKMQITVNGIKSSLANFSGSFGSQDLRFFYGNTVHAGWIVKDSLKIFERPRW